MQNNLLKAIIRSITPWAISSVVFLAVHFHYHISAGSATAIVAVVGTLLTIGAHALEVKWPWFGVFLGWIGAPAYQPPVTKAQLQAQIADLQGQLSGVTPASTTVPSTSTAL